MSFLFSVRKISKADLRCVHQRETNYTIKLITLFPVLCMHFGIINYVKNIGIFTKFYKSLLTFN